MPGVVSSEGEHGEHQPGPLVVFACASCGKNLKAPGETVGKKARCPRCGKALLVPASVPRSTGHDPGTRFPFLTAILLSAVLVACSIYGKLTTTQRGEYFNIARALSRGQGFSHPFGDPVGPTAWMAPVFPTILAGLFWLGDGNRDVVTVGVACFHVCILIATGTLVLALAWRTTRRIAAPVAAAVFFLATMYHFRFWFQFVDDCWLILLSLDLLIAGFCWLRPLERWPIAVGWGLFGGLCSLSNPIVGFAWGILTGILGVWQRAWPQVALALLCAALALAPWTIRNYLVFGRAIPVKSNLAFELYQSHCLQPDGLLQNFYSHPAGGAGQEGREFRQVGETAYLDRKWQQFREAVWANPQDFLDRVTTRFLGATLWYVPFNRKQEAKQPWLLWARRFTHPLPFLALLLLVCTSIGKPLSQPQWIVIGVYLLYLLPYIATSYYERYTAPLLGVKVLLLIWAPDRLLTWSFGPGKSPHPAEANRSVPDGSTGGLAPA
jgi:hypothetical protein